MYVAVSVFVSMSCACRCSVILNLWLRRGLAAHRLCLVKNQKLNQRSLTQWGPALSRSMMKCFRHFPRLSPSVSPSQVAFRLGVVGSNVS